jgi:hypothetical protein
MAKTPHPPSPDDVPSPAHDPGEMLSKKILDVEIWITYCHADGKIRRRELDTSKLKGIAWDHSAHDTKLPKDDEIDTTPAGRLPLTGPPKKYGECGATGKPVHSRPPGGACCWWNGSRWICPDDVE